MTDTTRAWDRLTTESDPAFEAFAAYLETGSLRDAYRQRSGKAQATAAPGALTGWSTKYHWVSRRAASRVIVENFPPVARVDDVSDWPDIEDLSDIPDKDLDRMREIRDAARAKAQAKVSDGRVAAAESVKELERKLGPLMQLQELSKTTAHNRLERTPTLGR